MKNIYRLIFLAATQILPGCGNLFVDSEFNTERQFKHDLYDDTEECQRRNAGTVMNCSEHVTFYTDDRVDCLLGGGDIVIRSTYKKKRKTIEIRKTDGLPGSLEFKIESDSVIILKSNNTRWVRL